MSGTKRPASSLEIDSSSNGNLEVTSSSSNPNIVRRHRAQLEDVKRRNPHLGIIINPNRPSTTFNIYKAILRHPNLFFQFTLRLPPATLLDLYAIDKEFHYRFNKHGVSLIHDFAKYHAPDAAYVFTWTLWPNLCISDPSLKPMDRRSHLSRDIPSLRWTKLVIFRDRIVRHILTLLALEGHRVPRATGRALMKLWLLMETKTQAARVKLVRNPAVLADEDILLLHLFLTKLDMRFSDPVQGRGMGELSHMLLCQRNLIPLRDVLAGKTRLDFDNSTDLARRTYLTGWFDRAFVPWIDDELENGVPESEWALMNREYWDDEGRPMEFAIDLVGMEGVRRGLNVHRWALSFLTYGYVDLEKGKNVGIVRKYRGIRRPVDVEETRLQEEEIHSLIDRLDELSTAN
ncbi:hypothetical protein BU24DRAFT_457216 [Aaosphaeria arxii CBS 175.79]|uniref:Uncharacterized protein n=1 Tax=Aaosphaeria arxii CBS 175.79 TaxID=1450172 RepID=A0A6A5Y9E3_9PLEO|nr:uncharacterized protein BU24DRAFT_457216 [Aaosphaeria arxii CBS 175.79]KAF2021214.1 hypothetical protein BU24DRAFT_457216 [Aaosphaeria arxii CBS 175.79]